MRNHPAIATLPQAMRELVLELEDLDLPEETRATCTACAVAAPEGEQTLDRPFHDQARCCTYHPDLPNFLLGRALRRGGVGRELILRRMENPEGLSPAGIVETAEWRRPRRELWFGRDPSSMCPYWQGGELACGIWPDRGAVCRTWYCKYVNGAQGYEAWQALNQLLHLMERRLAWFCQQVGEPPSRSTADTLVPWYEWCAERVEQMSAVELAELVDARLNARIAAVEERLEELDPPLPEVVTPSVSQLARQGERVWLVGFSTLSGVWAPESVFDFFSRLDGKRSWREALAQTNAHAEEPVDEALVHRLWREQLLAVPDDSRVQPGANLSAFSINGQQLLEAPLHLDTLPFSFRPLDD